MTIDAWHNFDGTSFLDGNKADASVIQESFALGLSIGSSSLHATAKAVVKAEVEAGATVAAPNGNVTLRALSGNYADSFYGAPAARWSACSRTPTRPPPHRAPPRRTSSATSGCSTA